MRRRDAPAQEAGREAYAHPVRLSAGFPAALGLAILLVGCPEVPRPTANSSAAPTVTTSKPAEHAVGERVQVVERAMGTRVTLAAYTTAQLDRKGVTAALKRAHAEIKRVELLMTTWRATSEVSRINAAAGSKAVSVSQETFDVIAKSIWISKLSSGVAGLLGGFYLCQHEVGATSKKLSFRYFA